MFYDDLLSGIRSQKQAGGVIDGTRFEVFIKSLIYNYHASIASEDLLLEAAYEASKSADDPYVHKLRCYYTKHYHDEKGEIKFLREDLRSRNINPGQPDKYVMAMIGTQYYMMKHLHPVSLLGYLAVAETDPIPLERVEILEKLHKVNLSFLKMHSSRDLEHSKEIGELIDAAPDSLKGFITLSTDNVLEHFSSAVQSWKGT